MLLENNGSGLNAPAADQSSLSKNTNANLVAVKVTIITADGDRAATILARSDGPHNPGGPLATTFGVRTHFYSEASATAYFNPKPAQSDPSPSAPSGYLFDPEGAAAARGGGYGPEGYSSYVSAFLG